MRITPKFLLKVILAAIVTVIVFPLLVRMKADAKSATWGEIKNYYGGAGSDSTNTNTPPPPPPPPPKN